MSNESIKFVEDGKDGFNQIIKDVQVWYKRNHGHVVIDGGIFGSTKDPNSEGHLRTLFLRYHGTTVSPHPQECEHPVGQRVTSIKKQPTCTEVGYRVTECTKCGKELHVEVLPKIPHDLEWGNGNSPHCLSDGSEKGVCQRCGYTISRVKPGTALGHDYVWEFNNNATCLEDGSETGTCSRCGDKILKAKPGSALGHAWEPWVTEVQPTFESIGLRTRTCSRCGEIETEILPQLILNMSITTANLNGGVAGKAYSAQLQTNAPAGSPVEWTIESGMLPPGVILNSNGTLSGTLNTAGTYTFVVRASLYTATDTKQYSINVASGTYTVTFNANGGTCVEKTRVVPKGSMIGTLPVPTRVGQEFGGWFTASTGGLKVDPNYSVAANVTLYARWGASSGIQFGDPTTEFNIQYNGERTNYNNNPYTLYHRVAGGAAGTSNLIMQTGIASSNGSNTANMTSTNKKITLYLKVTNNGNAGNFDIGFDCDSYVAGSDKVPVKRIANGVSLGSGPYYNVTVPYAHTAWVGAFGDRTKNRYVNSSNGTSSGSVDSGYAFTMNNIFINSGSYVILEVTFQRP